MACFTGPSCTDPLLYRDRQVLALKPESVRSISLTQGGREQALERDTAGEWKVVQPAGGVVVNARDITEQERLRERLADAQRLESIGKLAGGVAHDFNNLLTAILGGGEAILESLDEGTAPARDDVEAVLEAGARASELTRQLLAFARRQPIAPAPVDLGGLVRDMERLVRRLLPESIAQRVEKT